MDFTGCKSYSQTMAINISKFFTANKYSIFGLALRFGFLARVVTPKLVCVLFSLLSLFAQPSAAQESVPRFALVIGNNAYAAGALDNAVNDARLIAQSLKDVGFAVTLVENATQETMLRALTKFESDLEQSKGIGLFYYAGHGVQVRGENFLIPVNVSAQREDEVRSRALNAQEVIDRMSATKNRLNMIFLDACRIDPFSRGRRNSAAGLARLDAALGMLISYATSPGTVAEDGVGSNGPFAKHLASALKQPNLKVEDVLKRVRTAVREETRGRQITWDNSAIEGDFYFVPGKVGAAVAAFSNPAVPDPRLSTSAPSATSFAPQVNIAKDILETLVNEMSLAELKKGMRFFLDGEASFQPQINRYKHSNKEDVARQLYGKVLIFERLEERVMSYGKWTFLVLRLGDELFEISYSGSPKGDWESVKTRPYRTFQTLVSVDEMDKVRSALKGKTVYIMTGEWYDEASRERRFHPQRKKFVPIMISEVETGGNTDRKARVVFKDQAGNRGYVFVDISGGTYINGTRLQDDVRTVFSVIDPRENAKNISADVWKKIEKSELRVGMSKEEVLLAWGEPLKSSKSSREDGTFEYLNFSFGRRIVLRNEKLIEFNEN
jgi:uncharacterized caspase-like protein